MKRSFKKGERVRAFGKVMEVTRYLKTNLIELKSFDLDSKEIHLITVHIEKLSRV